MKRMKIMATKPAAETAAEVRAPEMDAAKVRPAKATASIRRTRPARGELILDVTPIFVFTSLHRRVDV